MRTHQALQKKSSAHKSNAPKPNSLASRPFAVPPKLEETARVPETQGYENPLSLAILNPEAGLSIPVQPKLAIGAPGDRYEQEADRVASQVVKQINSPDAAQSRQGHSIQRQEAAEDKIQKKPSISVLQRLSLPTQVQLEAIPENEKLQAKSILQRKDSIGGGEASQNVESAINRARGGGISLDAGLQQSMGQAMGADFSGVKVHTDAQSNQLNQSIQAKAFTTGQDVFFRQGEYNPGSRGGRELIAHELTHVVQQNGNAVQAKPDIVQRTSGKVIQRMPQKSQEVELNNSTRGQNGQNQPRRSRKRTPSNQQAGSSQDTRNQFKNPVAKSTTNRAPLKAPSSRTGDNNSQVPSPQSGTSQTEENNPFLKKYKPVPRSTDSNLGYEPVASVIKVGPSPPSAPKQSEDKIAYVINMAAVPGEETPGKVAQKYNEQGFDNESEVVKRLGMVMGVNKYRSIDGQSKDLVETHMKQTGNPEFILRVFGFTWELVEWANQEKGTKVVTDIATASDDFETNLKLNDTQKDEVLKKEKSYLNQRNIPYGLIREKITASSLTKELVKTLSSYNKHVYIHLGDADVLSLSAPENQSPSQQQNDQNKPKSLFSRYDEILKANQHPLMAIGGYDFRYESDGGDLDSGNPMERLTYLANQLDIAARKAIAIIEPTAIYPTEPNLVFLAQGSDKTNDLFSLNLFDESSGELKDGKSGELYGRGAREGRKFQKNLLKAHEDKPKENNKTNRTIYAPEASVATSSKRFKLTDKDVEKQKEALNKGVDNFKEEIIEHVISQSQSFLSPNTFALEVLGSLKFNKGSNKDAFKSEYTKNIKGTIHRFLNQAVTSENSPFKAPKQDKRTGIATEILKAVNNELNNSKYQWIWDELIKIMNALQASYQPK